MNQHVLFTDNLIKQDVGGPSWDNDKIKEAFTRRFNKWRVDAQQPSGVDAGDFHGIGWHLKRTPTPNTDQLRGCASPASSSPSNSNRDTVPRPEN